MRSPRACVRRWGWLFLLLGAGQDPAPEWPEGLDWLNTERPLRPADLRGKLVLLDFWTYGCINCIHILPDLRRLETEFRNELVVIGVHKAKFSEETGTENVRQAILRYGIEHPVVNDARSHIWSRYRARGWPTVILLDPEGRIVHRMSGEGVYDAMRPHIEETIERFHDRIDRKPFSPRLERIGAPPTVLSYPGKIAADADRIFISDSNHHRILLASQEGEVLDVAGNGEAGLADGTFEAARFRSPQGVCVSGDRLFVADTGNHAIRVVDLARRTVSTLAGTGKQAERYPPVAGGALSSPWDVLLQGGRLYVAMAGSHQLWTVDPNSGRAQPFSGSGREGRVDAPHPEASLAQPSGLATDGTRLYFADSESSAIRAADFDSGGGVETIVGLGLFDFGDKDGRGSSASLQHPLGVAFHDGVLYVADTYNNKIKRIDPTTKVCTTWLGSGEAGHRDGARTRPPLFDEPNGLAVGGGKLFIADTNNHSIRVADFGTGFVSTLRLRGLEKLQASMGPSHRRETSAEIESPAQVTLVLEPEMPAGFEWRQGKIAVRGEGVTFQGSEEVRFDTPGFPLEIAAEVPASGGTARIFCDAFFGRESSLWFRHVEILLRIRAREGAAPKRTISIPLK